MHECYPFRHLSFRSRSIFTENISWWRFFRTNDRQEVQKKKYQWQWIRVTVSQKTKAVTQEQERERERESTTSRHEDTNLSNNSTSCNCSWDGNSGERVNFPVKESSFINFITPSWPYLYSWDIPVCKWKENSRNRLSVMSTLMASLTE
jgi:hypothetical protein